MTTYLITGANRGIGLEITRQLHARGDDVIGTARDPDSADDLRTTGARVEQLDVADQASVDALAKRLGATPIDVLINNAGVFLDGEMGVDDITPDVMQDTFRVNSTAPLFVSRAVLPNLEAGERKLIVQISSQMGSLDMADGAGGHFAYRSSKAALNMVNRLLAEAIKDRGVAAVAMHPGWVQTDMGGPNAHLKVEDAAASIIKTIDGLSHDASGSFIDYKGDAMPW